MRFLALCLLSSAVVCAAPASADPATESEILVAGHRQTRPARDPTLAATRVDERELARPGANAASVLSHVPGVQISESGGSADLSTASVRGATSAQTPVYLAGIRLNDDVTGSADLSLIPLWMLSRAEIFRGNAPADADRLGIGGAVYFEPRVPRANRVRAGAQVGSFGERAGWLGAQVARDGDAALVAFRTASAHNDYPYLDNAGTTASRDDRTRDRPNADFSEHDAWAIGRTSLGKGGARLTTVFNAFEREQGVTGLAAVPALAARLESARQLAGLSARVSCGAELGCEIVLNSQATSARTRLTDPQRELGLLVPRIDSRGTRIGQTARVSFGGATLRVLLGANAEFERLALDGGSALRAQRSTTSGRTGLSFTPGEGTEVSAIAVATCDATHGPERADGCADLTPEGRLGVRQRFGAFELRSNLGRYARVPTLGELYGISALVRGSSALVPERGLAWDLGARWEGPLGPVWAYLDVFGFARGVSDLIAYRRSSLGAVQPYNVGSARILGGELEAGARWAEHVRASLALTVLDPRNTTAARNLSNDLIPYQSRLSGSGLIEAFVVPGYRWLGRAGLDARFTHRSSRLADPAGLLVLPASSALDLGASWAFGRVAEFSLRAALDDVFDAHRFDFIGYPVPGRRFHLALEASLP
ncbi:MAG: TonB-dependent receptor [Polyangiaceae bacterium]